MSKNIVDLPLSYAKRKRLGLRKGLVRCEVSERWLQFPKDGTKLEAGTFIRVDVMTRNAKEEPKKLCELILVKEDLLSVIKDIESKD